MPQHQRLEFPQRNWFTDNHRRLHDHLRRWQTMEEGLRTAVFDWDNTCIFNDIGDATLRYQLDNLALRLTPNELEAMLPADIAGETTVDGAVLLADISVDILRAYHSLWPHMQRGALDAARHGQAHQDFRSKIGWLYNALARTRRVGPSYAYPWLTCFFQHYDAPEIQAIARAAWQAAAAEPLDESCWQSATQGRAGKLQYRFDRGLMVHPEMVDLQAALQACGMQVVVITASLEEVVRGIAGFLGFSVKPQDVYGMRPAAIAPAGYPLTYRAGKAQIIERYLPAPPLLVAGDADTDFEMLTGFAGTEIRVVINRDLQGDIRSLYDAPKVLLQGRDENTGMFVAERTTLKRRQAH